MADSWQYNLVLNTGELLGAPCCCPACDVEQQPGHYQCYSQDTELVAAEKRGEVYRRYESNAWRWYAAK